MKFLIVPQINNILEAKVLQYWTDEKLILSYGDQIFQK